MLLAQRIGPSRYLQASGYNSRARTCVIYVGALYEKPMT